MVKKKSLFDDRPVEIQELTFIIKQDISALNDKIGEYCGLPLYSISLFFSCWVTLDLISVTSFLSLAAQLGQYIAAQQRQQQGAKNNKQAADFSTQVIVGLQSRLASTSTAFKDILEVRTQNMKAQKDRREQFSVNPPPVSKSPGNYFLKDLPWISRILNSISFFFFFLFSLSGPNFGLVSETEWITGR